MSRGVASTAIRRVSGLDAATGIDVPIVRLLMYYFDIRWRNLARAALAARSEYDAVAWVEDDCEPLDGFTPAAVLREARRVSPAVSWQGWIPQRGLPRWGSHLVVFTRDSLATAEADLRRLRREAGVEWQPSRRELDHAHCFGIDTWLWRLSSATPPLAVPMQPRIARQRGHPLRGRR